MTAEAAFQFRTMQFKMLSGISPGFPELSQSYGQVTHVLLTRPPLTSWEQALNPFARLACIRHAASVHPEPGSNSPIKLVCLASKNKNWRFTLFVSFSFQRTCPPLQKRLHHINIFIFRCQLSFKIYFLSFFCVSASATFINIPSCFLNNKCFL